MAPDIHVDDEVYAVLQSKAQAFVDTPNTVLRRELGLDSRNGSTAGQTSSDQAGGLRALVESGALRAGQMLEWRRREAIHRATVSASGHLLLEDDTQWGAPSAAARHLAGYEVNGWRAWRTPEGQSLANLRGAKAENWPP